MFEVPVFCPSNYLFLITFVVFLRFVIFFVQGFDSSGVEHIGSEANRCAVSHFFLSRPLVFQQIVVLCFFFFCFRLCSDAVDVFCCFLPGSVIVSVGTWIKTVFFFFLE